MTPALGMILELSGPRFDLNNAYASFNAEEDVWVYSMIPS